MNRGIHGEVVQRGRRTQRNERVVLCSFSCRDAVWSELVLAAEYIAESAVK